MIKTILILGALSTSLVAVSSQSALAQGGVSYKSSGKKHAGHSSRYKRSSKRGYGSHGNRHARSSSPSFVIVGGGSSARANASGNSVTIGAGLGGGEAVPLNPVSHVLHVDQEMIELANHRSQLRDMRGWQGRKTGFTIIAGKSPGGDRTGPTIYMPESYEAPVDGGDDSVIYIAE